MEIEMAPSAPATTRTIHRGWRARSLTILPLLLAAVVVAVLLLRPARQARTDLVAPGFTLPAVSGARGLLSLHALRGHAVLLNFFNSNCPPCIEEMPVLRQTARAYHAQGVLVLGVATGGDTRDSARTFAQAQRMTYPVVVDEHQDVAWRYDVAGWPTSFFVDARGRLRGQFIGPLDAQTVRAGLAQAGAVRCAQCSPLTVPAIGLAASAPSDTALSADAVFPPGHAASGFALTDQQGRTVTLRQLRGKVVVLTFVSSICTQQCPLVGKGLALVRHDLGRAAAHLAIVAISVDPEADTARTIRHFAVLSGWQGAGWHYLVAPRRVLAHIWAAYGVYVGPPPKPGQDPEHYAGLYLIDPRGHLRAYDDVPFLAPRVAASVRALLAASS